jgi:hypothetical protein
MRKAWVMFLLLIGLTFIYNPQTESGFAYINNSQDNYIIIVDPSTNTLYYFKGVYDSKERMDEGMDKWMKDKIKKVFPFKSYITPAPRRR